MEQTPHARARDTASRFEEDEIDLLALVGALLDQRWTILSTTAIAAGIAILYAVLATPIYEAGSMLQVEEKSASLPGLEELSDAFSSESSTQAELEIIKSRSVVGKAVDELNLTVSASAQRAPLIGNFVARRFRAAPSVSFGSPVLGMSGFGWGGERIQVDRFDVPRGLEGLGFELIALGDSQYTLEQDELDISVSGRVGDVLSVGEIELFISVLEARPGTTFDLIRQPWLHTVQSVLAALSVSEVGRQSGIVRINYTDEDPVKAERVVDAITSQYVAQNIRRLSAEAENSLIFMREQIPFVKRDLEAAENEFNDFASESQSIDITAENQAILSQLVELDTRIQELELQRVELDRRFTANHPNVIAVQEQYERLLSERRKFNQRIEALPSTQQRLFSLRRNLEVANGIYELLLYKSQEMEVARASTVGNVRVVDSAIVDIRKPVAPKKALIVVLGTLLGGFLGVVLVLLRRAIFRGIENAEDIEKLGLPVFANVPHSAQQQKWDVRAQTKLRQSVDARAIKILAEENPTDLVVEMIRNLRTSLYFNLSEAENRAVLITGPSPGVGKSFITVNLAVACAQAGQRVLLIDADLRRGYLHRYFEKEKQMGLADYLAGRESLASVVMNSHVDGLDFISRGTTPPNPSELLMHSRMDALITELSQYDLVLIDSPPLLAVTDAAILAQKAGNTLLVARFDQTSQREIAGALASLSRKNIHVTGAILNGVQRRFRNYYGYGGYYGGYGYGYGYKYQSED